MFEPVSESLAKSIENKIAEKTRILSMQKQDYLDFSYTASEIFELQEDLCNIYIASLMSLSKVIEQLRPGIDYPQWRVKTHPANIIVECQVGDKINLQGLNSYEDYLRCIKDIKVRYWFHELIKTHTEKEQQWGDRLKERLCSYRKLSAFN